MSTATKSAARADASKEPRAFTAATDYLTAIDEVGGAGSLTLTGVPLQRTQSRLFDIRGCTPILLCLCVHDSPDNPCPCKGPIFWIPNGDILFRQETRRQGLVGGTRQSMIELRIQPKSRVFLDQTSKSSEKGFGDRMVVTRTEKGEFTPVAGEVWVRQTSRVPIGAVVAALDLIKSNDQVAGIIAKEGGALDALVKAFSLGWLIGGVIEEELGLADKISDWMIDTFGPWPF